MSASRSGPPANIGRSDFEASKRKATATTQTNCILCILCILHSLLVAMHLATSSDSSYLLLSCLLRKLRCILCTLSCALSCTGKWKRREGCRETANSETVTSLRKVLSRNFASSSSFCIDAPDGILFTLAQLGMVKHTMLTSKVLPGWHLNRSKNGCDICHI